MGAGSSKQPSWYPGEPAPSALAECPCAKTEVGARNSGGGTGVQGRKNVGPTATTVPSASGTGGNGHRHTAATPATTTAAGVRGGRDASCLPAVELADMEFIANGAFCDVFSCKYRDWEVVAKRVRADMPLRDKRAAVRNLWAEYECLRGLQHPNIIDVYGMCRLKGEDDPELSVCLLLERLAFGTVAHLFGTNRHLETNLANAIDRSRKKKMVPFRARLNRVLELAAALEYVHGGTCVGTIMHRDIKSVNIGFAQNGNLKLIDFGLAKVVGPIGTPENETYQMTGEVGSYRYMAPELVKHEPYNAKADIYSWAVISWEILTVRRPYSSMNETTFVERVILKGERPPLPKDWPEVLKALLTSAWSDDLTARPTAEEVVIALRAIRDELAAASPRRSSFAAASIPRPSLTRRRTPTSAPTSSTAGRAGEGEGGGGVSPNSAPPRKGFSFTLGSVSPVKLKEDRPATAGGAASVPARPTRKFSFRSVFSGNGNNGATSGDSEDEALRPAPPLSETAGNQSSVRMSCSSAAVPNSANSPDLAALSSIISSGNDSASTDGSNGDTTRDCGSNTIRRRSSGSSGSSRCASSDSRPPQAYGALENLRETIADALMAEARAQNLVDSAAATTTAPATSALAAPAFDGPPGGTCAVEAARESEAGGHSKNQESTEMTADVSVASKSGGLVKKDSERARNCSIGSEGDMIGRSSRSLTKLWPSIKSDMITSVEDQPSSSVPTASAVPRDDDTLVAAFSACDVVSVQGDGGGQNSGESAELVPTTKVEVESADEGEGMWQKPLVIPADEPLPPSSDLPTGRAKNEVLPGATDKSILCGAAGPAPPPHGDNGNLGSSSMPRE